MKSAKIFELSEKINRAVNNPAFPTLPRIEFDLLLQNTRQFYEELIAWQNSTLQNPGTESQQVNLTIEPELPKANKTIHANKNLLLDEPVVQKVEIPAVKDREKATEGIAFEKKDKNATINNSATNSGTLNEKLKASSAGEVHKKLATKPLKDLIDLNKRFALLNELFKGNAEAFSSAVAHIDSLPDFDAAQAFIQSQLAGNYFWDESAQTTRLFMKLVRQKFGLE